MPLGTSMDSESEDSRSKGCWDPSPILKPFFEKWTSASATPDFVIDDAWCGMVGGFGFGAAATTESSEFWTKTLREVYKGDEGRRKARMAVLCLLERDGLLLRLRDVKCPVYWLQVSRHCWSLGEPVLMIRLFKGNGGHAIRKDRSRRTNSPLYLVQGGQTGHDRGGCPLPQRYPPRTNQRGPIGSRHQVYPVRLRA